MSTAIAHNDMFQTAYRQITAAERSFVDWVVRELREAARRLGERITAILDKPLPEALRARDTKGFLGRPLVRAAITERINDIAETEEINPENLLRRVHMLGHTDPSEYWEIDEVGDPWFDIERMKDDGKAGVIKSIDVEKSDGMSRSTKTKIKVQFHDPAVYLKMEMALMGLSDGESTYGKEARNSKAPTLPADATMQQTGDAYAAMIGDE